MPASDDHTPRVRRTRTTDVAPLGSGRYRLADMSHHGAYGTETDAGQSVIHDTALIAVVGGPDLRIESIEARPLHLRSRPARSCCRCSTTWSARASAAGWRRIVLEVAGGMRGCTHVNTVLLGLGEMIPLVYFLMLNARVEHPSTARADARWMQVALDLTPQLVDACASLHQDGPVLENARQAFR